MFTRARTLVIAIALLCAADTLAQTTINGADLALKSSGSVDGTSWMLDANGYVGTYVTLDHAGELPIDIFASGRIGGNTVPKMNIVVGDDKSAFEVTPGPQGFATAFSLPAGTHFIRIEFPNAGDQRALTILTVRLGGATVSNEHTDANALAAANTYIQHFRQGPAKVKLIGVEPGTPVRVKMKRIAFNFGANVPGVSNRWLADTEEAANFQKFFLQFFNTTVPSNGGKWLFHEAQRDVVTTEWMDTILDFARRNHLYARMHNLLWDHMQQPEWALALLDKAVAGDEQAKQELRAEISERIAYYVADRAKRYQSIDVLNEAWHVTRYWQAFGAEGIADIHNEVAQAAADGGNPGMLICTNEYNVLQHSSRPGPRGSPQPPDPYANWYREQVEQIRDAGGVVSGIGVQYYAQTNPDSPSPHSAARIHAVMQNLSITGLPIELTEFGIRGGAGTQRNIQMIDETMRMMMGTPNGITFLMFGFYDGATANNARGSSLVDADWNITEVGKHYEQLMAEWSTDVTTTVEPDGTVNFTGYYGDYELTAGDKTYQFTLTKGQSEYEVGATQPQPTE